MLLGRQQDLGGSYATGTASGPRYVAALAAAARQQGVIGRRACNNTQQQLHRGRVIGWQGKHISQRVWASQRQRPALIHAQQQHQLQPWR